MSTTASIRPALRCTVLLAGSLIALVGQSPSFLLPQYIPIGAECCSMLTGDFNGDGKMDIAVAHGVPSFTVLLGNGDGTFTRKDISQVVGSSIGLGFAADLNSDGILDLLAVVDTGSNPPSSDRSAYRNVVFFGNGDGSFRSPVVVLNNGEGVLGIADFNGDGIPDLLVQPTQFDEFAVRLGNGDGTFRAAGPTTHYPDGDCCFVALGDFNHDRKPDVAMISVRKGTVYVSLGNSDGTFQPFSGYPVLPAGNGFKTLAIADLNRDGNLDVVKGAWQGVGVLLGNGDGTFRIAPASELPVPRLSVLEGARSVVADLNGDGIPDVANGFTVFRGNGDGTLQAPAIFGQWIDSLRGGLAAADFNGDGKLDLIGVAPDGMGLSLLINNTGASDASVAAVSAANYGSAMAPGSIATIFGKALTAATASATTLPLPTVLQNTKVKILDQTGVERLAGLFYVSPSQINFLVPPDAVKGYAIINVDNNGKTPLVLGARATPVRTVAPGFFTMDGTGHGPPAATAVAIQSNGTRTMIPVFQCSSARQCALTPIDLNANGTVYLSVYGTGFANGGAVCDQPGGTVVTYSGPQRQFPGLDQLNLQLPKTLPSGTVNITCQFYPASDGIGESPSASFTISIK